MRSYVARWKAKVLAGEVQHGLRKTYQAGCRCVECKEAERVYYQRWYQKRHVPPVGLQ